MKSQGGSSAEFGLVPVLEQALQDHDCGIVISSTWRERYSLQALRERLGQALGRRVFGTLGQTCEAHTFATKTS
jgi:hypothetical protein